MKAWEWAVWIALCLVPLAVAAASLGSLPDTVAMHVGPDGTIRHKHIGPLTPENFSAFKERLSQIPRA